MKYKTKILGQSKQMKAITDQMTKIIEQQSTSIITNKKNHMKKKNQDEALNF